MSKLGTDTCSVALVLLDPTILVLEVFLGSLPNCLNSCGSVYIDIQPVPELSRCNRSENPKDADPKKARHDMWFLILWGFVVGIVE
jgi:hypothetical protein